MSTGEAGVVSTESRPDSTDLRKATRARADHRLCTTASITASTPQQPVPAARKTTRMLVASVLLLSVLMAFEMSPSTERAGVDGLGACGGGDAGLAAMEPANGEAGLLGGCRGGGMVGGRGAGGGALGCGNEGVGGGDDGEGGASARISREVGVATWTTPSPPR